MNALRRLFLDHRRVLLALVALALAVRALVPGGWMLMAAADGTVRLTLCSGMGPIAPTPHDMRAMAGMRGMAHHDEGGHKAPPHADHPCAFAGLGFASDLPVMALPVSPRFVVEQAVLWIARAVAIGRGLAAPPPPQTGPPVTA